MKNFKSLSDLGINYRNCDISDDKTEIKFYFNFFTRDKASRFNSEVFHYIEEAVITFDLVWLEFGEASFHWLHFNKRAEERESIIKKLGELSKHPKIKFCFDRSKNYEQPPDFFEYRYTDETSPEKEKQWLLDQKIKKMQDKAKDGKAFQIPRGYKGSFKLVYPYRKTLSRLIKQLTFRTDKELVNFLKVVESIDYEKSDLIEINCGAFFHSDETLLKVIQIFETRYNVKFNTTDNLYTRVCKLKVFQELGA